MTMNSGIRIVADEVLVVRVGAVRGVVVHAVAMVVIDRRCMVVMGRYLTRLWRRFQLLIILIATTSSHYSGLIDKKQ